MATESPQVEIIDARDLEPVSNGTHHLIGQVAMPPDVKKVVYYIENNSNQLVIPRYAYEFNTTEFALE